MAARSEKPSRDRKKTRAGTIALVGRPNVGKSTLLNTLLGERIAITSPHPETTRDRIAGILTRDNVQYVFLDTPGLHRARHELGKRMNEIAETAATESDVVVFMTDVAQVPALKNEDKTLLALVPANKPTILVINKVDRVTPKDLLFPVLTAYSELREFDAVVPLSARRSDSGQARLLEAIGKVLPEGDFLYPDDELSDRPTRFFVSEFVREQVLKKTREEIPHGVAVVVESFEEGDKIIRIAVTIHVAKESHKAILIGKGGAMLRSIGTDARKRTEELLGRKAHLETHVRATPKWVDDPAKLKDLGYAEMGAAPKKSKKKH